MELPSFKMSFLYRIVLLAVIGFGNTLAYQIYDNSDYSDH